MRVQIYSDIHLEFYNTYPHIKPKCKNINSHRRCRETAPSTLAIFYRILFSNWNKVYYVLGNHEFYHNKKSIQALKREYTTFFSRYQNIHLLDCSTDTYEDILIVGCTLWSYVDQTIQDSITDFRAIKYKHNERTKSITP